MMEIWLEQLTVGERNMDKETRIADVKHPKVLSVPNVGDVIIGTVAKQCHQ